MSALILYSQYDLIESSRLNATTAPRTLAPFGLPHRLSLMWEFAVSSFHIMLAHRVRYVVGVLNYMVYAAVNYYLWEALFKEVPAGGTRAGYTLRDMATYVCVGWIIRSAYFSNSDNVLSARILKGEINSDLLRPVSLLLQYYGAALGEALFRALFMALPVLVLVLLVFDISPPANAASAIAFVYSAALAFHIFFAINFLTGLIAAWTERIQGFLWAKFMLIQFLSGLLLPFPFLPNWLRVPFEILPFAGMNYIPMQIYLGQLSDLEMWSQLLLQTGWTILLMALCVVMWNRVRRRLETLGG